MTWTTHHQRMTFMANLIDRAVEDPDAALDFNGSLPDVERLFGSEEGLLLSLQQRWATMLTAALDQADYDDVPTQGVVASLKASQPGLRALLDAGARRSVRLRALRHSEDRIVEFFGGSDADVAPAPAGV